MRVLSLFQLLCSLFLQCVFVSDISLYDVFSEAERLHTHGLSYGKYRNKQQDIDYAWFIPDMAV